MKNKSNLIRKKIELKGGIKMKGTILIISLLLAGVFAGVFVFAETENVVSSSGGAGGFDVSVSNVNSVTDDSSIDVSEIETTEIETDEVEELLHEVENVPGFKRVGFVKTWRGHGWISGEDKGHLITGFWASQKFAKINTADKEVEEVKTIRTFGRLRIAGVGVYRLIRAPTTEEIDNTNSVNFYVLPINKKIYAEESELSKDSVGKLVLTRKEELKGLTIWDGKLNFESGILQGSWDVELGTDMYVIRPYQVKKIKKTIGQIQSAKVRINEAVAIAPSETSETGEVSSETDEKEIQIKPVRIKIKKFLWIIPTGKKFLEVEVTKDGETYTEEIKENEAKEIEDYSVSVGDLEDDENIEFKVE